MTATYTKPAKTPRWADTSSNILEPPEAKKDEGWLFEEIPPSSFENWRTNLAGSWFKWIGERLFDGASKDELLIKSPGSAVNALLITDTYVKSHLDFRVEGDDLGLEVDGTSSRRIYFDAAKQSWLGYNLGTSRMELYAGGTLALWADATQCFINGDLVIGDDLSLPGGLAVGIATPTIVDDVIQLGDADNKWDFNSGNPRLYFGSNDFFTYDRATEIFYFYINNAKTLRMSSMGISADGIHAGDTTSNPTNDCVTANLHGIFGGGVAVGTVGMTPPVGSITLGDTECLLRYNATLPYLQFAAGDQLAYDRTNDKFLFKISTAEIAVIEALGAQISGGLRVGFSGSPTADRIELGDPNMFLQFAADVCEFDFAAGSSFSFSRTNSRYAWLISTFEKLRLMANGLSIADGLQVGFIGTPTADRVEIGDANFYAELATNAIIRFNSDALLTYDRSLSDWTFTIGGYDKLEIGASNVLLTTTGLVVNGGDVSVGPYANNRDLILSDDSGSHPNQTVRKHFHCSQVTGRLRSGNGTNVESYPVNLGRYGYTSRAALGVIASITVPTGVTSAGNVIRAKAYLSADSGSGVVSIKVQGITVGALTWSGSDRMRFDFECVCNSLPSSTAIFYGGTLEVGTSFGHGLVSMATLLNTFNTIPVDLEITSYTSGTVTLHHFSVDLI